MSAAIAFQMYDGNVVVNSSDQTITSVDARYSWTFTTGGTVAAGSYVAVMDQSSGAAQQVNISEVMLNAGSSVGNYSDTPSSQPLGGSGLIIIVPDSSSSTAPVSTKSTTGSVFLRHHTNVLVPQSTMVASLMSDADLWDVFCSRPTVNPGYVSDILDAGFSSSQTVYYSISGTAGPGVTGTPTIKTYIDAWDGTVDDDPAVYNEIVTTANVTGRFFRTLIVADSKVPTIVTEFSMFLGSQSKTVNVTEFAVDAGGTTLDYSGTFHSPPNIQITPSDGTSTSGGASNITATSATIQLFKGENAVTGKCSITITGGGVQQGKLIIGVPITTTTTPSGKTLVSNSGTGAVGKLSAVAPSSQPSIPYMLGFKSEGGTNDQNLIEGWLGRPLQIVGNTITTQNFMQGPYKDVNGNFTHVQDVSFPALSIFGEGNNLTDMNLAANGSYDSVYQSMLNTMAAEKNPCAVISPLWEGNGNWYTFSPKYFGGGHNGSYDNYIKAFRRIAIMAKKTMPNIIVNWCLAWGVYNDDSNGGTDPTKMDPGAFDAVNNPGGYDVITMDLYQANITHYNNNDVRSTWAGAQSGSGLASGAPAITLDWMTAYASARGVKVGMREYAAGDASDTSYSSTVTGANDGNWVAGSIAWMNSLGSQFIFQIWSNDPPADGIATNGVNPNEQTEWKKAWSNTVDGSTWWKGPKPRG